MLANINSLHQTPVVEQFHDHSKCNCQFIPPHMKELIKEKLHDPVVVEQMKGSEAHDKLLRKNRAKVIKGKVHATIVQASLVSDTIRIYDAGYQQRLPGDLIDNPKNSGNTEAENGYKWLQQTLRFYSEKLNRRSFDDKGMAVIGTVNYPEENAFWTGDQMAWGVSNKYDIFHTFGSFTEDIDVTAHEGTHGMIQYAGHFPYQNESGALNESLSDIFGCTIKQFYNHWKVDEEHGWLVGDLLITPWGENGEFDGALRSMTDALAYVDHPVLGSDPQPKHMADYFYTSQDNGGVHYNSGIPNHWYYLFCQKLYEVDADKYAYAWGSNIDTGAIDVVYKTVQRLKSDGVKNPKFSQFATTTVTIAEELFGYESHEARAVKEAWSGVGIPLLSSPKTQRKCCVV